MRTHQEIDQRSLALHRLVADKIRHDPALFDQAKITLAHWRTSAGPASRPYLEEWARLLNQGIEACLAVAVDDSERATALRQSSPLSVLLTNRERFEFLENWKRNHEAQ